jgi:hypothetical protein
MKQQLVELKEEIEKSTIIVGEINTTFLTTNRTSRQKISKHLEELNNTKNQQDVVDTD